MYYSDTFRKWYNKLGTNRLFKPESYVIIVITRSNRSAFAKFGFEVAPIKIKTGRYKLNPILTENKTCFHCIHNVEDEFHV